MMQHNTLLAQILSSWVAGQTPTQLDWQQLADEELASPRRAKAFGITPENVDAVIQARSHLFQSTYSSVLSLPCLEVQGSQGAGELFRGRRAGGQKSIFYSSIQNSKPLRGAPPYSEKVPNTDALKIILSLWTVWLPLAMQLASFRQQLGRPLIQGILGGQGTGKTTLAAILSLILSLLGDHTLSLSLDDLYKTYEERQRLQKQDPRLIWRGPPGTHDVELGKQLLDQIRQPNQGHPILVPRFDKSAWGGIGDRTTPELVDSIDIVLFEGWFVGVRPINPTVFDAPTPAPIESAAERSFARDMNDQLKDYVPLWERLDRLMILYPTDYRLTQQWRRQAEQQMIATGRSGMTGAQLNEFVKYFWKSLHPELFITPLTKNTSLVDLVIEINPDHSVGAVYQPGSA